MRQPHYRITFARSTKTQRFDSFLNEMACGDKDFYKTLQEFETTFLAKYRRVERTDIGTRDNECDRYIYESKSDDEDRIYMYVYPPR
jgi:hypothetical protein